jgi:hypothetical protein
MMPDSSTEILVKDGRAARVRSVDLLHCCKPDKPQHVVQFYAHESDLICNISYLLEKVLQAGESGVIIATRSHLEMIETSLKRSTIDLELRRKEGRFVALEAEKVLPRLLSESLPSETKFEALVGKLITEAKAKSRTGFVFVFGELVALLCAEDNVAAAIRLEQIWNLFGAKHSFSLYCGYPLGVADADPALDTIFNICAEHSLTLPSEVSL